jgi:hypothetical protein
VGVKVAVGVGVSVGVAVGVDVGVGVGVANMAAMDAGVWHASKRDPVASVPAIVSINLRRFIFPLLRAIRPSVPLNRLA